MPRAGGAHGARPGLTLSAAPLTSLAHILPYWGLTFLPYCPLLPIPCAELLLELHSQQLARPTERGQLSYRPSASLAPAPSPASQFLRHLPRPLPRAGG